MTWTVVGSAAAKAGQPGGAGYLKFRGLLPLLERKEGGLGGGIGDGFGTMAGCQL